MHGCNYFMQNNELLCRIQQGFNSANFVNISCDQQLTPNRTSVGAKLRRKVAISDSYSRRRRTMLTLIAISSKLRDSSSKML